MHHGIRSFGRIAALLTLALLVTGVTAWGTLALHYTLAQNAVLRPALIAALLLCGLAALAGLAVRRWRLRALGGFAVLSAVLFLWWDTIEPSNDRDWKPEVAVMPQASIEGDLVTLRNIRNFDYRSETNFTPGYYDKTFDLRKLEGIDVIASYWAGPHIAHIFLSFDFGADGHLAMSIERRDERGEGYSTVRGLFRQYELFYVVADERDVIRLRTNVRADPPEQVYLYRVNGPPENARRLFLEYIRKINTLHGQPEFYNTMLTNCTTNIWLHTRVNHGNLHFSWKVLASGHVPEYLYELGRLDRELPFAELQRRSLINDRARAVDNPEDFSSRIRDGLPGFPPSGQPAPMSAPDL